MLVGDISTEDLPFVFGLTGKTGVYRQGDRGDGLPSARRILRSVGGDVVIESSEERGTIVRIRYPKTIDLDAAMVGEIDVKKLPPEQYEELVGPPSWSNPNVRQVEKDLMGKGGLDKYFFPIEPPQRLKKEAEISRITFYEHDETKLQIVKKSYVASSDPASLRKFARLRRNYYVPTVVPEFDSPYSNEAEFYYEVNLVPFGYQRMSDIFQGKVLSVENIDIIMKAIFNCFKGEEKYSYYQHKHLHRDNVLVKVDENDKLSSCCQN